MKLYLTTFYCSKHFRIKYSVDEINVRGVMSSDYSLIFGVGELGEEYFTALNKMIKIKNTGDYTFQYCILTLNKFYSERHLDKINSYLNKKSHFDKFYDW